MRKLVCFLILTKAFYGRTKSSVKESISDARLYASTEDRGCGNNTFTFTTAEPAHGVIREAILGELLAQRKAQRLEEQQLKRGITSATSGSTDPPAAIGDGADDNDNSGDAEGFLLAKEVLQTLQLHTCWSPQSAGGTTTETVEGHGNSLVANVFYDVSNEAEDEEDATRT